MDIAVQPAAPNPSAAAPDWTTVQRDVLCPLCNYNLRGLVEPRCPECGYRFDWDELLHPERLLQEYLFESRPEHNGRAFFHTLFKSLRPKKFWSTISPSQRPSARRLVLYWALACIPAVAGILASSGWAATSHLGFALGRAVHLLVIGLIRIGDWYGPTIDLGHGMILVLAALMVWPWLSFLALNVFVQSMFRVRIDAVHVLRCVTYAAGVTFIAGIVATLLAAGLLVFGVRWSRMDDLGMPVFAAAVALLWGWVTHRLIVAYRLYLRFDRPVATVLASQVIVLLVMVTIVMWATFYGSF